MAYRKDSFSKSQFLGSLRLCLPAADLRRAETPTHENRLAATRSGADAKPNLNPDPQSK